MCTGEAEGEKERKIKEKKSGGFQKESLSGPISLDQSKVARRFKSKNIIPVCVLEYSRKQNEMKKRHIQDRNLGWGNTVVEH